MLRAMVQSGAKGEMLVAAAGVVVLAAGVVGAMHAPHAVAMAVRWLGVAVDGVRVAAEESYAVDLRGDG